MNIKKICKILGTTAAMMSILIAAGVISSTQAYAAEEIVQGDSNVTTDSAISINENKKNDYTIDVNSSVEKEGFKLTIKNVTATRHNMKVVASIESSKLTDYNDTLDAMMQMTVKNSDSESYGWDLKKVEDNSIEYTFNLDSFEGFNDNIQLRFDAILPKYDLNAWVETCVDISKYLDKSIEKDVKFSFGDNDIYKIESDILGTSLYYNEKQNDDYSEDSFENSTWDSQSKLLLRCNDKLYEIEDENSFFDHENGSVTGYYRTKLLNIDDIDASDDISIIPIKCNIKRKEIDSIIDGHENKEEDSEENNIKYRKEFKFADNSKGIISKVERNDDKVKIYFSSASEKDNLLMALSMRGYYDFSEDSYPVIDDYHDMKKIIYKNPDDESGYIVEFDNVNKNRKFIVDTRDLTFSHNDKFEMCQEIKMK